MKSAGKLLDKDLLMLAKKMEEETAFLLLDGV